MSDGGGQLADCRELFSMQIVYLCFLQLAGASLNPPFQLVIDGLELLFRLKQRLLDLLTLVNFESKPVVCVLCFFVGNDKFSGALNHPLL